MITLTATLDSPLPSARISTAVPSYTSPKAPLPKNLCKLSLSRGKAGSDSISAWEGRVLQNSNTSHLFIPKDVRNSIKIQIKQVLFVSSDIFKGSSCETWMFWKLLENKHQVFFLPCALVFLARVTWRMGWGESRLGWVPEGQHDRASFGADLPCSKHAALNSALRFQGSVPWCKLVQERHLWCFCP